MIFNGVPPGGGAGGGGGGAAPRPGAAMGGANMTFVPPSDLPDYKPAFFTGSVRADADGNFWSRTIPTKAITGGPVYDVVNNRGELVDRVQVPAERSIVGFGSGGLVYLTVRENNTTFLERARVR